VTLTTNKQYELLNLLEQYKDRIFRICGAYVSNTHDQEDLFQEVVINLWKALDSFRGDSLVYTFFYRVTVNVCMRWQYQAKKEQGQKVSLGGIHFVKPDASDIQTEIEGREAIAQLYQCIYQLQETDKSIILLYLEEVPYREIAGIIGISENHVAVKVKRIKSKLYECLKQQDYV